MIFQHKPGQKDNNAWTVVWHGRCIAPVKALVATRNQMGEGQRRESNWYFFTYLVTLYLHYSCTHFSCVGVSRTPLVCPTPKKEQGLAQRVPSYSQSCSGRQKKHKRWGRKGNRAPHTRHQQKEAECADDKKHLSPIHKVKSTMRWPMTLGIALKQTKRQGKWEAVGKEVKKDAFPCHLERRGEFLTKMVLSVPWILYSCFQISFAYTLFFC